MRVSESELQRKSSRRKLCGVVLVSVSIAIGLFITFGLPSIFSNPEPQNVPTLAFVLSLLGLMTAFAGGLVIRSRARISALSRGAGVLIAAIGIFVGFLAWEWSYGIVPWAWAGYDYSAHAFGYWLSAALSLGGGLLFGLKKRDIS